MRGIWLQTWTRTAVRPHCSQTPPRIRSSTWTALKLACSDCSWTPAPTDLFAPEIFRVQHGLATSTIKEYKVWQVLQFLGDYFWWWGCPCGLCLIRLSLGGCQRTQSVLTFSGGGGYLLVRNIFAKDLFVGVFGVPYIPMRSMGLHLFQ